MWGQIDERYKNSNEAQNVEDEDYAFDDRQQATDHGIDEHSQEYDRPTQKRTLPFLSIIVGVVEDD